MGVDAELEDDGVGGEGAQERRDHGLEGGRVHGVVRVGLEWEVDGVAEALALADLLDEARAREEPVAPLVAGERQHVRVAVEGELDPVAVVGVDVHIGNLPVLATQGLDGEHRIVDIAEARGAVRHGVMQAAREMEGAGRLAVEDELGGQERAARGELGRLPETWEDRVVSGAEPVAGGVRHPVSTAHGPEDLHVLRRVEPRDRLHGGGLRREHLELRSRREAIGLHEPPRQPQPLHAQRVLRPVVEPAPLLRVDERGLHAFFRRHTPDLPPDFSTRQRPVITTPRSMALTMS